MQDPLRILEEVGFVSGNEACKKTGPVNAFIYIDSPATWELRGFV
jgi:hypothetical protein